MTEQDIPSKNWVAELERIMSRLRDRERGCPWDLEQSHQSLKKYLIEEAYELLDAIDANNDEKLVEELGDVLLQVIFHCQVATEEGRFNLQDVAQRCCEKLVHRHPHVFGEDKIDSAEAVLVRWEQIKHKEPSNQDRSSLLDGIPRQLPALWRAEKMQKKASRAGFDWPSIDGVMDKIDEEMQELKESLAADDHTYREELGDVLFALVNLARFRGDSAEELLIGTIDKFYRRFRYMEAQSQGNGKALADYSLEELEQWWQEAKKAE